MSLKEIDIEEIVYKHFKSYPTLVEKIKMGVMTHKFIVEVREKKYVVRFYPDENSSNPKAEYELLKSLTIRSCRVPEVICFAENEIQRYLIYQYIEGEALSVHATQLTPAMLSKISSDIFQNLTCISNNAFKCYGTITKNREQFSSWNDFLQHSISKGIYYLYESNDFNSALVYKIEAFLKKEINNIKVSKPQLTWSDFSLDNIIIHKNKIEGFVDFEGCMAGDPILALSYFYSIEGDSKIYREIEKCYLEKYKFDFNLIAFYVLLRLCRLAPHLNSPLPNGDKRAPIFEHFKGFVSAIKFLNDDPSL